MSGLLVLVALALAPAPATPAPPSPAPGPAPAAAPSAGGDDLVLEALAHALTRGTRSELERAEVIYRWVAHNVSYDVAGLVARRPTAPTVSDVLERGVALCGGYSELYRRLARLAGLEARTLIGYAKAYGYEQGTDFRAPNHAWNAVRIDGEWHLLDVTWGAGRIDGGHTFVPAFDSYWFLTPAEEFAFTHLPLEPRWQLLPEPLSLDDFERQPAMSPSQFLAGFAPEYLRVLQRDRSFTGVPDVHFYGRRTIRIHNVPLERTLAAGERREFRLEVEGAAEVVVVNGGVWHRLWPEDGVFDADVLLREGPLTVNARYPERGEVYWPVMVYAVEGGR
ncbi:MAG TPA: transglutaminase domain-containing protein [Longimicrobiales bacterium]|nr:transglutaminase domain-containing protein [Longimicrobiales bacterium]